jgi:hypothetical protein
MKYIKITNEMAKMFSELRESSIEPTFMLSYNGVITHGCKVIKKSNDAVFVHIRSFNECGGFWMPVSTYQTLKDAVLKVRKNAPFNKVNYTQAYYQY